MLPGLKSNSLAILDALALEKPSSMIILHACLIISIRVLVRLSWNGIVPSNSLHRGSCRTTPEIYVYLKCGFHTQTTDCALTISCRVLDVVLNVNVFTCIFHFDNDVDAIWSVRLIIYLAVGRWVCCPAWCKLVHQFVLHHSTRERYLGSSRCTRRQCKVASVSLHHAGTFRQTGECVLVEHNL